MEYLKKPDFLILRNRAFYYWSLLRLYIRIFPYAAINDWIFGNGIYVSCLVKWGFLTLHLLQLWSWKYIEKYEKL